MGAEEVWEDAREEARQEAREKAGGETPGETPGETREKIRGKLPPLVDLGHFGTCALPSPDELLGGTGILVGE